MINLRRKALNFGEFSGKTRPLRGSPVRGMSLGFFENRIVVANGGKKAPHGFLMVRDLCQLLGKSETTIRRWARAGILKCHRIGRDWLFAVQDVEHFIRVRRWSTERNEDN